MPIVRQFQGMAFALVAIIALGATSTLAADYPAPRQADWIARDFKFSTGETLPELKLHYTTIGEPSGEPVLILHGTGGSGTGMLTPAFAGDLFGPGQPLDARKYFIILPDAIGHGGSSKPSAGLRMKFPRYTYDDMVLAQYRLLTEGLGIKHLRLVLGNSMGGMETWTWAEAYPDFMDVAVPMAAQPTAMAARNWMMRRLIIDGIKSDPDWKDGNYTTQPRAAKLVMVFYAIATSGGTLAYQVEAGTHAAADKVVDDRLAAPFSADANDVIYHWDSSRTYDAAPRLSNIRATVLAINSADDERNPPETGVMAEAMTHVKNGRLFLIPVGPETRGHSTTGSAKLWKEQVRELLASAPKR